MAYTERAPDTFAATPLLHEGLMLVGDRKAGLRLDAPAPLSRLGAAQLILPGRSYVISAQVENALRCAAPACPTRTGSRRNPCPCASNSRGAALDI